MIKFQDYCRKNMLATSWKAGAVLAIAVTLLGFTYPNASGAETKPRAKEHGLSGAYFLSNQRIPETPGKPVMRRVDRTIDFDWSAKSPGAGIPLENYAVRWTGKILADVPGLYFLLVASDDGVILTVDGQRIIDDWTMHGLMTSRRPLDWKAGWHTVQLDYVQLTGTAIVRLSWIRPGGTEQIIPSDHLSPR